MPTSNQTTSSDPRDMFLSLLSTALQQKTSAKMMLLLCLILFPGKILLAQAEKMTLHFDWPAGLVAHVERMVFKAMRTPGQFDSIHTHSRYRLTTQPHPAGLLLQIDSIVMVNRKTIPKNWQPLYLDDFLIVQTNLLPNLIISPKAECMGIENISQIKEMLDSLYRPIALKGMEENEDALQEIEAMLSEKVLADGLTKEWFETVRWWNELPITIGSSPIYLKSKKPSPLFPHILHSLMFTIHPIELTPCKSSDTSSHCVTLHRTTAIDSNSIKDLYANFTYPNTPIEVQEFVHSLEQLGLSEELIIVMDPDTMIPYSVVSDLRLSCRLAKNPIMEAGDYSVSLKTSLQFTYE